jgi:hypothetical protein
MKLHVVIAAIGFISAIHPLMKDQAAILNLLSTLVAAAKQLKFP